MLMLMYYIQSYIRKKLYQSTQIKEIKLNNNLVDWAMTRNLVHFNPSNMTRFFFNSIRLNMPKFNLTHSFDYNSLKSNQKKLLIDNELFIGDFGNSSDFFTIRYCFLTS